MEKINSNSETFWSKQQRDTILHPLRCEMWIREKNKGNHNVGEGVEKLGTCALLVGV